ncbi:MAG: hypothetical protein H8K07_08735 [Nitrospira sp.]|jgi:hypothetical protein|nr:hypothetical protein [Nitrospira sp.]MDI3462562.1 hypothetical protein [Nitrospira sp.]
MPYPEFDKTVAELVKPWFFGLQAGATYQNILTTKFNAAPNQQQIDAALSLGGYLGHSEANKQQRAALRAVLLVNFLMKSYPVQYRDRLKERCEKLDLAALKRAFASSFPVGFAGDNNRSVWDPIHLTSLHKHSLGQLACLTRPRVYKYCHPLPPFRFIIHGVGNHMGKVFDDPTILTQYEVLSMSLMSNLNVHAHDPQGVILRVHQNNILAASPTDVGVKNYAPGFKPDNLPNTLTITENLFDIAARTDGLKSPNYLLQNVRGYPYYNEVVVCGKAGVRLPHGVTRVMSVVGLYMSIGVDGVIRGAEDTRENRQKRVMAFAKKCNLPVLYIPRKDASPRF